MNSQGVTPWLFYTDGMFRWPVGDFAALSASETTEPVLRR